MNQKQELKTRVEAKQKSIEASIASLRNDTRQSAQQEIEKLKTQLAEAEEQLKTGWDKLTEASAQKLNSWLAN